MAYGLAVFLAAIIAATQLYESIAIGYVFKSLTDLIFILLVMTPPFLAGLRLIYSIFSKSKLLENEFKENRSFGYLIGMGFVYFGHFSVAFLIATFISLLLSNGPAYASGVALIVPLILYFMGVLLVELSRAVWKI